MRKASAEICKEWLESKMLTKEQTDELLEAMKDENDIEERFYCDLEFGTAGMRGIIGMGTNRMNIYTVRRAAQGMSEYVIQKHGEQSGVVIGYDTRYFSKEFAYETACGKQREGLFVRKRARNSGGFICHQILQSCRRRYDNGKP